MREATSDIVDFGIALSSAIIPIVLKQAGILNTGGRLPIKI